MILRFLFILNCFQLTAIKTIAQSNSFNDQVNHNVDSVIRSMPPKIDFSFFLNGKPIKHDRVFSVIIKSTSKLLQCTDSMLIPISYFSSKDSISFSVTYNRRELITSQIHINHFLHGGKIIFNLLTNYRKELQHYIKDSITYINTYRENNLYRLFSSKRWKYQSDRNENIYYIIIKSNSNPLVTYLDGKL